MIRTRTLAGAAAFTAALGAGAVAGVVLGVPGVTAAQTDDTTGATDTDDGTADDTSSGDDTSGQERCHDGGDLRGPGLGLTAAAEALGMDADQLRDELRDGATIAEIAEEQGVALDDVVEAFADEAEARIDEKLDEGRLDEDRAAELREDLEARIEAFVEDEHPVRDAGFRPHARARRH